MILSIAHLQPIVSLIAGVLILIVPRLLNYIFERDGNDRRPRRRRPSRRFAVRPRPAILAPNQRFPIAAPRRPGEAVKLEGPRSTLVRAIVIATAAIGVAAYARYAGDPAATASLATPPATVPIDRLMTIVPLPDLVQGSPSASITIIEYASTTCSHCAAFHETTWPELKAKYIESGRAKFILREFPLDPLATASFMLARCAGSDKRDLWVDLFFSQQKTWAFGDRPVEALLAMAERIGMSRTDSENCMKTRISTRRSVRAASAPRWRSTSIRRRRFSSMAAD